MSIKLEYDPQADAAYLKLSNNQIIESEEIINGVVYDYGANNEIVGIEILNLKAKSAEQFKQLNFPFSPEDREFLKEFFMKVLV